MSVSSVLRAVAARVRDPQLLWTIWQQPTDVGFDFPQSAERGCDASGKEGARDTFGQPAPHNSQEQRRKGSLLDGAECHELFSALLGAGEGVHPGHPLVTGIEKLGRRQDANHPRFDTPVSDFVAGEEK